jgi:hypothetical protein
MPAAIDRAIELRDRYLSTYAYRPVRIVGSDGLVDGTVVDYKIVDDGLSLLVRVWNGRVWRPAGQIEVTINY